MLYIALAGSGIAGASMQVYMSYLINFVERTLGMRDYVMPLAVIIVCSAVLAGVLGFLMDKFGRKHFFIPLVAAAVIGTLGIYLLKFLGTSDTAALLGMLIPVGIVTMTAELSVRQGGMFPGDQDVPFRAPPDDNRSRDRQRHNRLFGLVRLV